MAKEYLNEEQRAQLAAMLEEEADAANPPPMEEEPELEEAAEPDEVDTVNDNVEELDEGDAEGAEPEEPRPDPNAGNEPAPQAPALPEGIGSIDELIAAYGQLKARDTQRGDDLQALRELNGQLVSIAEALGYGQGMESIDLSVDESLARGNPAEFARQQIRKEIGDQLKPMIEQQQKNLRGRLIDQGWKAFAGEHADVSDMMDEIQAYLKDNPELYDNERGLEVAYHMARSGKYVPEKTLMENEDFIGRAAANPKVKEKVIEEYLEEVGRSGSEAVASVGGGGRSVPAGRKKQPQSIKEAHKLARKLFGG